MNIVKQSTGNVVLTDAAGNIQKVFVNVNALDVKGTDEVIVKFGFNQWQSLFASQIGNTQVEPSAAVPFSGNAFDLVALLSTSFFFELSGGGGDDLATVLIAGNSAGANDINLNNNDLLNTDKIDFNLATIDIAGAGQLVWNDADGTLDLGLKGGNVTLQIGQEQIVRVVNKTATNVNLLESDYQVVRVTGAQGQRLKVDLALATTSALSIGTLGIVTETINNNQEGFITTSGLVRGINTTGSLQSETWVDGDVLYLSGSIAGGITNIKPTAPLHEVRIGYVVNSNITQGSIFVKIEIGYQLDELDNVSINPLTLANKDVLTYESATQLWKNTKQPVEIQLAASDETTALTTGTSKMTFRMPHGMTLTSVRASLTTAQASGSIFTVDINQSGSSVLGTKLTIDNTEKTSTTAATAATIVTSALIDDSEITIDIDQIGDGTAKGLKLTLIGTR